MEDINISLEQTDNQKASEQFLVFLLEGENYGFPILKIDGIISIPSITKMPKAPNYVKGVINVRGQIIPVFDLRAVFCMPEKAYDERTCVVLIKIQLNGLNKLVGFIVDTVSEVFDIPSSEVENPPTYGVKIDGAFLKGIGKVKDKIIMLLDIDKIISIDESTSKYLNSGFNELAVSE